MNGGIVSIAAFISILIGIQSISIDDEDDLKVLYQRLGQRISCNNKQLRRRLYQKGQFWVAENFVVADHGQIDCHSTITLATTADVGFLDNLVPLVRRWNAPISLTLYAPGADVWPTVDSIKYLRNCLRDVVDSNLIRQFVSFHLFYDADHVTVDLPDFYYDEGQSFCDENPMKLSTYRRDHNLSYYINVPRNIARDAAITHFILPSDIELYPSENFVLKFLRMIAFDERPLARDHVYVVPLFEVTADSQVPNNKRELVRMLDNETAVEFHVRYCEHCAKVPQIEKWKKIPDSNDLKILTTVKRQGDFNHWEPIFIGTSSMPYYEERHLYSGTADRMTKLFVMCLLDYDFSVLDNVFLVHRPGIKLTYSAKDHPMKLYTRKLINQMWLPEYESLYGPRLGCHL